jgi:hypothetical protein
MIVRQDIIAKTVKNSQAYFCWFETSSAVLEVISFLWNSLWRASREALQMNRVVSSTKGHTPFLILNANPLSVLHHSY